MKYQKEVYEFLTTIPKGKVVTYQDIAIYLGNKNLSRVIGNVLHKNDKPLIYPCFKVVNSKGELAENFAFGGKENQKKLLEEDGVVIEDFKVDLTKFRWTGLWVKF